jgi:hypothetical protein
MTLTMPQRKLPISAYMLAPTIQLLMVRYADSSMTCYPPDHYKINLLMQKDGDHPFTPIFVNCSTMAFSSMKPT